ncbi:MAG TPA: hypothetical protein VFA26_24570 [Gemmataceae bacterium]|nr:hypothetical protein [Gemmataceae bacterium]
MIRETFERAVRTFLNCWPFKPFVIELFSGDRILVTQVETARLHGALVHHVCPPFENQLFDHVGVCQVLDVPPDVDLPARNQR